MEPTDVIYKKCELLFGALIQDDMSKAFFGPMQEMSMHALKHNDQAYLRRLLKELLTISRDFPERVTPDVMQQIDESAVDVRVRIAAILKKGSISSREEFELVNEYIDLVHQDPRMAPVVEALGRLLLKFEQARIP